MNDLNKDWLDYYYQQDSKSINIEALKELRTTNLPKFKQKMNLPFMDVLNELPSIESSHFNSTNAHVSIGDKNDLSQEQSSEIKSLAKKLIPWRKGPFNLFDTEVDAEWRSDLKWDRLKTFIPDLKNKKVLDVGCNNGYFMYRMASQNPELVLGIDPIVLNYCQFQFMNHFAKKDNLKFEIWGQDDLIHFDNFFDVVFSMGVIYHHRNPIQQLLQLKKSIKPGGTLILETIGIPGDESYALFPEDRYAKMRNVWFVPTKSCFINWVKKAKFKDIEFLSDSDLNSEEQRLTEWCPPPRQSLDDFLSPEDQSLTIEGHPAPRRFLLKATV